MRTLSVLALLAISACAESYYYAPEGATVIRNGVPAQVTKIPPELPQGDIEISSTGLRRLRTSDGRTLTALHVQMIVDNEGDQQPWIVNTGNQIVELPGVGSSRPMFANASGQAPPMVAVGRRQRVRIDLYYPAPAVSEKHLPAFDFLWEVQTPERSVSGRAHFDRLEPYYYGYDYPYYYNAWGPYWWYDPFWPSYGFGRPFIW